MSNRLPLPHPNCYYIPDSHIIAGEYPFHADPSQAREKLCCVLDAGVTTFVDLTDNTESLAAYELVLRKEAASRGLEVAYHRLSIVDNDVPTPHRMAEILGCIAAAEENGQLVYLHCWGGVGRTGTVVGCYLVRNGMSGDEALAQVRALFGTMSEPKRHKHRHTGSPQTEPQREFIRRWAEHVPKAPRNEALERRVARGADTARETESFDVDIDAVLRELKADTELGPATLLPVICAALDEREMTYELDEEHSRVELEIKGAEVGYTCILRMNEQTRLVGCYLHPPLWVPEKSRAAMCEAIARANYDLPYGNFELDLRDGELRYRTSIDVEGGELVPTMVHNLISAAYTMCERYHPAFMHVIYGGISPQEAIEHAEA